MRDSGEQDLVEVAQHCLERLRLLGRRLRQARADLPGPDLREHGPLCHPLEVVGGPVDCPVTILAERTDGFVSHFLTRDHGLVLTICSLVSQARRAWPMPSVA